MPHYLIKPKKNSSEEPSAIQPRIVEAKNQSRALAFVVEDTLEVVLAQPNDFMELAGRGGKIEKAE